MKGLHRHGAAGAETTPMRYLRCAFLLVALTLPLPVAAAGEVAPGGVSAATVTATVGAFHERLVEVMKAPVFRERAAVLEPAVPLFFDMQTVCRLTLGRSWRELDEARRSQFRGLLEQLIVATYADRFDSFSGQRFINVESVPARQGWVVKTELVRANGERVNLDYYFNGDAVYNVVADGVSDLSLRRADYGSIIRREGYAALVAHLEQNIAELHENEPGRAP